MIFFLGCLEGSVVEQTNSIDQDRDGFSIEQGDCNDANELVFPDGIERCDGLDNNCDGLIDQHLDEYALFYRDFDEDGFGGETQYFDACSPEEGWIVKGGDCDDSNPLIFQTSK